MKESLKLTQTQRLQQTLAPMQLQLVRMLEMNAPEIEEEVRKALDENPALDAKTEREDVSTQPDDDFDESAEQMQLADYASTDDIPSYRLGASNRSADDDVYEPQAVAHGDTLYDVLMAQLAEDASMSERDMQMARFLVGNLDDNGYMTRSLSAIADDLAIQEGLDVADDELRRVWQRIRRLDPPGVGASDLRDSLLLQLKRRGRPTADESLAIEVIRDYFDLFSLMHFDRICSLTGTDRQTLRRAINIIKQLNPKPGGQIGEAADDRTRHITPDFQVEVYDDHTLTLTLLNRLPQLQIEETFADGRSLTRNAPRRQADAANAFIRQKRDEASMFIKALDMRQQTLFRVMSAIMQWQREFFLTDDPLKLRPMILKDIAAVTGDDVSVISRATTGKYVATRQGIYPLKFFFNERRNTNDEVASSVVLDRLKSIIDSEDKASPLSDAAISEQLIAEGYDVARRTVAKYREKLGIPVGRLRKTI